MSGSQLHYTNVSLEEENTYLAIHYNLLVFDGVPSWSTVDAGTGYHISFSLFRYKLQIPLYRLQKKGKSQELSRRLQSGNYNWCRMEKKGRMKGLGGERIGIRKGGGGGQKWMKRGEARGGWSRLMITNISKVRDKWGKVVEQYRCIYLSLGDKGIEFFITWIGLKLEADGYVHTL